MHRAKIFAMTCGTMFVLLSSIYLSLDRVSVSDSDLRIMISKQYHEAVEYDDKGWFDLILLGHPQMEIGDFGFFYYIRHLGVVPFTHRNSIVLLKMIKEKQLSEIKKKDEAYKEWLIKEYKL